jgi:hypothetical protein
MKIPVVVRRPARRRHHRSKKKSPFFQKITFSEILFRSDIKNKLCFLK